MVSTARDISAAGNTSPGTPSLSSITATSTTNTKDTNRCPPAGGHAGKKAHTCAGVNIFICSVLNAEPPPSATAVNRGHPTRTRTALSGREPGSQTLMVHADTDIRPTHTRLTSSQVLRKLNVLDPQLAW
jgi:hypothetical protein